MSRVLDMDLLDHDVDINILDMDLLNHDVDINIWKRKVRNKIFKLIFKPKEDRVQLFTS